MGTVFGGAVSVILVVLAIGYVVVRRMVGEPAEARRMLVLPVVLGVLGVVNVVGAEQSGVSVGFLAAGVLISAAFGVARGVSARVDDVGGLAYVKYTVVTVVLWLGGIAAEFGSKFVFGAIDHHAEEAAGHGLMLSLGVGILAEGVVVLVKVSRSDTRIDWSLRSDRRGSGGRRSERAGGRRTSAGPTYSPRSSDGPDYSPPQPDQPPARPEYSPRSLLDDRHAQRRQRRDDRRRRRR